MPAKTAAELTRLAVGETVTRVDVAKDRVEVCFASGRSVVVEHGDGALRARFESARPERRSRPGPGQPTARQRDYLEFIARFLARFGVSPAESDIARHFMVSAPSVNQMVRTLEARGFISRDFDILTGQAAGRSIRLLIDV
jgi:hypothetical protein